MLIVDGFFENGVFVPEKRIKGQKAFEHFTQYCGVLPSGFDYKKELSEYRDKRYGHID